MKLATLLLHDFLRLCMRRLPYLNSLRVFRLNSTILRALSRFLGGLNVLGNALHPGLWLAGRRGPKVDLGHGLSPTGSGFGHMGSDREGTAICLLHAVCIREIFNLPSTSTAIGQT